MGDTRQIDLFETYEEEGRAESRMVLPSLIELEPLPPSSSGDASAAMRGSKRRPRAEFGQFARADGDAELGGASQPQPRKGPGLEVGLDGYDVGRDPRKLSQGELREIGHAPKSPGQALRERCIDCCTGSADEVRKCTATNCPSWPFRMGANPWRTPSEGRREAGRKLAASRAAKALEAKLDLDEGQSLSSSRGEGTEGLERNVSLSQT